ncbi:GNAT family N-acetyltransferase [Jeotgalibacillus sp. S-D1]|uniref:GNAT family N-acetyltransferase n=1 Tax=Jeotgalibacillus sp. S-D1 TaxID=2552189 RepID=UPI001404A907|nr:GNAT family N-acetyltransferase [Jeotgalibacillus sp. S-D1]
MLRGYKQNDEIKINELFFRVFQTKRSIEEWNWKFSNSLKHRPLITVYEEDDEIVGHAAALVFEGEIGGKRALFAERIDVMVHPAHRGKGVYQKVIQHLMEQCQKNGINFVYGYPAPKAKELFIRYMDGREITYVPRLMKFLSPGKLVMGRFVFFKKISFLFTWIDRLLKKSKKIPADLTVERVSRADAKFDLLWDRAGKDYDVLLKRDADYLNWRYFEHPTRKYEVYLVSTDKKIIGYFVIRKETQQKNSQSINFIHIIDLLCANNGQDITQIVLGILSKTNEADIVSTWSLSHTNHYKILKSKAGFFHIGNPMPLVGKALHFEEFTENVFDKSAWYVSQGDVDSY